MMNNSYRVLHVEDDTDYAEMFALQISRLAKKHPGTNIDITHVISVDDALAVLAAESFHIVISDYQLGTAANGLDLLKTFRKGHRYLPFVFLTGQGDESIARNAFLYKATDYFTKDVGIAGYERIFHAIVQYISHHHTASARKSLEQSVLTEARRLRLLLETIPVLVVSLDTEGNITLLNKYACNLLGYDSDDVIGKNWFSLCIAPDIQANVREIFKKTMRGVTAPDEHPEHVIIGKDGAEHIVS